MAEARAFVSLLLEASQQDRIADLRDADHAIEFLADCTAFAGLPEAINEGLYLVPRLTRDQSREAIEEPIRQAGAEIENRLVNELLNSLGDDPDQLPILEHALMRLWSTWEAEGGRPAEPRPVPGHRHARAIAGEPPQEIYAEAGASSRWSR